MVGALDFSLVCDLGLRIHRRIAPIARNSAQHRRADMVAYRRHAETRALADLQHARKKLACAIMTFDEISILRFGHFTSLLTPADKRTLNGRRNNEA
jgi:hypothetical protein